MLDLRHVPRAIVRRDTRGLIKLIAERGAGRVVGVHMLADGAGDAILAGVHAIQAGVSVERMASSWNRTAAIVRLAEAMVRRSLMILGALYLGAAVVGHIRERTGSIACGCHDDCWCRRPGLSLFRWAFPFRHRPR